jgi:hypothetical protein
MINIPVKSKVNQIKVPMPNVYINQSMGKEKQNLINVNLSIQ